MLVCRVNQTDPRNDRQRLVLHRYFTAENCYRIEALKIARSNWASSVHRSGWGLGPWPWATVTFVTTWFLLLEFTIIRMTLESLLLSGDRDVESVLRPTLEKLAIEVEVCREARSGSEILLAEKFDAVIVDCDDLQGGLALLEGLRATPSNRNSVSFALLNGKKTTTQQAFGMGANFVLQKPISALNATRCFNAALNFMVRERRRYFRQPVKMVVSVFQGNKESKATSTNVSEGGMALILREALPKGATPRLKFMLPDVNV